MPWRRTRRWQRCASSWSRRRRRLRWRRHGRRPTRTRSETLLRFSCWTAHKPERGLLRTYLRRTTALSRAQVAWLIAAHIEQGGLADGRKCAAWPFRQVYTREDILLLAETDALGRLDRTKHTLTDHTGVREARHTLFKESHAQTSARRCYWLISGLDRTCGQISMSIHRATRRQLGNPTVELPSDAPLLESCANISSAMHAPPPPHHRHGRLRSGAFRAGSPTVTRHPHHSSKADAGTPP